MSLFLIGLLLGATFTAEQPLFTPTTEPAAFGQFYSAAASDGTDFMVLWIDDALINGSYNLFAARLDATGAVLDPQGILVDTVVGLDAYLTYGGSSEGGVYYVSYTANGEARVRRISRTGQLLDASPIIVGNGLRPDVASDGDGALVVWESSLASGGIQGRRVGADGSLIGAAFPVTTVANTPYAPRVDFSVDRYLVIWQRNGAGVSVAGARVSTTGVVQDATAFTVSTGTGPHTLANLAPNGAGFLVAWLRNGSLVARRVALNSTLSAAITISAQVQWWADLTAFNGQTVVTFERATGVYTARVDTTPAVLDMGGITTSALGVQPSIAASTSQLLVAFSYDEIAAYVGQEIFDIRAQRLNGALTAQGTPSTFPVRESAQYQLCAASNGQDYLLTWREQRAGEAWNIYAARVNANGTLADSAPIAVATGVDSQTEPAVVALGSTWFVAWTDLADEKVKLKRIDTAGTLLDPTPRLIAPNLANAQSAPVLATDGSEVLAAWAAGSDIYVARIDSAGQSLDPGGLVFSNAAGVQEHPVIAYGNGGYLVAWEDYRAGESAVVGGRFAASMALDGAEEVFGWFPAGSIAGRVER
jgi:hypothetical protein